VKKWGCDVIDVGLWCDEVGLQCGKYEAVD